MPSPRRRRRRRSASSTSATACSSSSGDDHVHRAAGAAGEVLAERDLAVTGLGCAEHQVGLRHAVGVELQ